MKRASGRKEIPIRVLGIDLGDRGGIVVLTDDQGGQPLALEAVRITPATGLAGFQRIVYDLARRHRVELIATERPGPWGRVKIGMAQRGRQDLVRAVCQSLGLPPIMEFQPQEIKRAITGHGRADKAKVMRCVNMLVRLPEDVADNEHTCDAAAIALLALSRERARRWRAARE